MQLLEPWLQRIVMIGGLYLGCCVGDDFIQAISWRFFAHEGTHAFLELLKDVFGFLEPSFEVSERAEHQILFIEYFVHLVSDIFA